MKHKKWIRFRKWLRKWLMVFLNPHMLLCFGISWMITNGWSYLFVGIGTFFHVPWMTWLGAGYLSLLWLPFTPEKIITVAISILLLRWLFPKDQKTLAVLHEERAKLAKALKKQWAAFREKWKKFRKK